MADADYLLALKLQAELNGDESDIEEVEFKPPPVSKEPLRIKRSNPRSNLDDEFLNRTQNLVHPQWETLDPTPDIFALFGAFDTKFFQGRLKCVTLEWSKKMYSCAGICYYRSNRLGTSITVRLSEPLLKLRPRKDLVETMLHEMIHAYCFVLNIREGNGGHGPNFKRIMTSINKVAGTNITVYHTFHDEVNVYKQHWWRCNGACQNRAPFFGYVKRTSNRAPSANDQWWQAHLQTCGGTFMKIKEPEKPKKQKAIKAPKVKAPPPGAGDLRKFLTPSITQKPNTPPARKAPPPTQPPATGPKTFGAPAGRFTGPVKINGGGTMVLNPKTSRPSTANTAKPPAPLNPIASAFPPTSYPGQSCDPFKTSDPRTQRAGVLLPAGGNLRNVKGFRDLNSSGEGSGGGGNPGRAVSGVPSTTASRQDMFGRGYSLDSAQGGSSPSGVSRKSPDGQVDRNHLRNVWASRFGGGSNEKPKKETRPGSDDTPPSASEPKRRKLGSEDGPKWVPLYDGDVMVNEAPPEVISLDDSDEDGGSGSASNDDDGDNDRPLKPTLKANMTMDERQTIIKQEILDDSEFLRDEDIVLIDDEYDDKDISGASEVADTSVVDEFFGDDTLMSEFERENGLATFGGRSVSNPEHDIISCPICQEKMRRSVLGDHLNGCMGIAQKVLLPKHSLKRLASTSREVKPTRRPPRRSSTKTSKDILRDAGYSEADIARLHDLEQAIDESPNSSRLADTSSPDTPSTSWAAAQSPLSPADDENSRRHRQRNLYKTTQQCPVCAREVPESDMNEHLDECLS